MNSSSDSSFLLGIPPIFFLPLALLITFFLFIIVWFKTEEKKGDSPFRSLLARLPGQSLSKRIDQLYEKVVVDLLGMFLFIFLWILLVMKAESIANLLSPVLAILMASWMVRTFLIIREVRRCSLDQKGEQLTGQHLQLLLAHGYQVFHDIILDGGNIDHVIVGPNGVFVVETKTRKKLKKWDNDHALVRYDEKGLSFPNQRPQTDSIERANEKAFELQSWLTTTIGESIRVMPMLSLPGWTVARKMRENPPVLNPQQLSPFILDYGVQCLWDEEIQKITKALKERSDYMTAQEYLL